MSQNLTRREALKLATRFTAAAAAFGSAPFAIRVSAQTGARREFNVRDYGAVGDGTTLDSPAIQRAIDEAAAAGPGARVIVPGGKRYLIGAIKLKGAIDFHLADDAELFVSIKPSDFGNAAAVSALDVQGLTLSGTGTINGRSREFMTHFDEKDEWWRPGPFRPRLVLLTGCRDLTVKDLTFAQAPSWTLHLLGCDGVLVDRLKIRNQLDVPNCDGIDPDHCKNVEIRKCDVVCGDDAVVIKTSRRGAATYHGCDNIVVKDCVFETQDSGVKIGTETVGDIRRIRFEHCEIKNSCRGCTIQLRDEGDVSDIVFRDIRFRSRYFSAPWWGRGEAISFTAIPRTPQSKLGKISNVRVEQVTGVAENSVRISGCKESRVSDITFDQVEVTLDRWTKYEGAVWDNRPTSAYPDLEPHKTPGIHVRHADNVALKRCRIAWGKNRPDYFSHALEAEDVTNLTHPDFTGEAAHPERDQAISIT